MKVPAGLDAELRRYVYEQWVRWEFGGRPLSYGVPPLGHDTVSPLPIDQSTRTGCAVTVTDTDPVEAVAETARKLSTQSQVSTFTTWSVPSGGFRWTPGNGICARSKACWATAAGSTPPAGIQTIVPVPSGQIFRYHAPSPSPPGLPHPFAARSPAMSLRCWSTGV